ncbi:4-(cytidine 5'-diphospho)-2-C-methyl-D-erythritol kinase [Taklimakanibacter lacteus]|uniref:4-(cytidine 5'-diphospho)-2-C-methyl-D-erythritol kinase n=1 Tax=Taklimakanibacter lacteus TaxID=2268456 RepID=UPI000E66303E
MLHSERAPAKINLALHVLGRGSDGYHELDSIVAFADVADRLSFADSEDWQLAITGPFAAELADTAGNLVLKAARDFADAFPARSRPYHITLEKNLPIAAGIGGGSADAAACLRGLAALAGGVDAEGLRAVAAGLGADVPVCLLNRACRMRGVGDRLEPLADVAPMPAVLVNPRRPVATAEVFAKLALAPGDSAFEGLVAGADIASYRNDLTAPALALEPVIAEVIQALQATEGVHFARMSGSGATCFGIFPSVQEADAAAIDVMGAHPDWWVMPTKIG